MSKRKKKTHYDINTIDCYISEAQDSRDNARTEIAKAYHAQRVNSLFKVKNKMEREGEPIPAIYIEQVDVIDRACLAIIHGQVVLNY